MKLFIGISLALVTNLAAQLPMSDYTNTFNSSRTRGYFFQAPVDFEVTGAMVPDENNRGTQMVAFYNMTAAPPAFSLSRPEKAVFFAGGVTSGQLIPISPSIKYKKGDWFGVLGACGPATGSVSNSYGAGEFPTTILGTPVTMHRFIMQLNISPTKGDGPVSSAGTSAIARVRVFIKGGGSNLNYGGSSNGDAKLLVSSKFPPLIDKKFEVKISSGTITGNTGGIIVIGILKSSVTIPGIGTLLCFPYQFQAGIGAATSAGIPFSLPIPKDTSLIGFKVFMQAALGSPGGLHLTDGMAVVIGS